MAAGYLQEVVASSFNFIGDFGQITWNFLSLHSLFWPNSLNKRCQLRQLYFS